MQNVIGLRCVICQQLYSPDEVQYICPKHGNEGILDVVYDYEAIKSQTAEAYSALRIPYLDESNTQYAIRNTSSMFAYRPLLPVAADTPEPPLLVGNTPLYNTPRLAAALGVAEVWVKDDGRNPTASLKDRASAIAVMKAQEVGAEVVTTASTGNAAAALAGLAASVGLRAVIFVPAAAPPAKIAQLLTYGATVLLVEGSYDDAFELCLEASDAFGWYCRNTAYNPYMAEGKKTVVYELYEQLQGDKETMGNVSNLQSPISHIFVSVGDGCIISGVHKGVRDLLGLGVLDRPPRLMGVQAAGSAFLYDAWVNGEDVLAKRPITAHTVADSISAGLPRDRVKAMAAVRETGGAFIKVSDEEILAAIPTLARGSGVFAEPAAAAAYAGLARAAAEGLVGREDRVAVIVTGNGLKDVGAAMKAAGEGMRVRPDLAAVRQALSRTN